MILDYIIHAAYAAEAAHEGSASIATMFGLNLKLFIAQLINFGIVLLVLWKWVFTPVTKALQKRTQKIEESLKAAEKVNNDKLEFEKWKAVEMTKTRQEAAEIVSKAKAEAENVRTDLLAKAKQEQEQIFADGEAKLVGEQVRMIAAAKEQLASLVVNATEKILMEKLTDKKDLELARKAVEQLK